MNQIINNFIKCGIQSARNRYGLGAMFLPARYIKFYCKRGDKINVVDVLSNENVDTLTPYAQLVVAANLSCWNDFAIAQLFETSFNDEWKSTQICNDLMTRSQAFKLLNILLRKYHQEHFNIHFAQYLINVNSLVNVRNFLKVFPDLNPNQRRKLVTNFIKQLKVGVWKETQTEVIYAPSEPTTIY